MPSAFANRSTSFYLVCILSLAVSLRLGWVLAVPSVPRPADDLIADA